MFAYPDLPVAPALPAALTPNGPLFQSFRQLTDLLHAQLYARLFATPVHATSNAAA